MTGFYAITNTGGPNRLEERAGPIAGWILEIWVGHDSIHSRTPRLRRSKAPYCFTSFQARGAGKAPSVRITNRNQSLGGRTDRFIQVNYDRRPRSQHRWFKFPSCGLRQLRIERRYLPVFMQRPGQCWVVDYK